MSKVLLVSDRSLFAQGLEDLLCGREGIEFVGRRAPGEALAEEIRHSRPDAVLIDCSDPGRCPAGGLVGTVCDGMLRSVVCVSLADNSIFVLHGERRMLQGVEDLVAACASGLPAMSLTEAPACAGRAHPGGKEEEPSTVQL